MPVIELTAQLIPQLTSLNARQTQYCDASHPGLVVEARAGTQNSTYYVRYKKPSDKKTAYKKLGRTTDISLTEARRMAKAFQGEVARGSDPRGEEKTKQTVLTFTAFFTKHYLPYVTPRKRSWKRDEELFRLRIQRVFGDKQLDQISRQQIQAFHTALLEEGLAPATCDHHIKLLKHAFNLAIDWDLLKEKNPATRIPLFNVDNRVNHVLDQPALRRLLAVLDSHPCKMAAAAAKISLHTGCRLNECLTARWADIDLDNKLWHISGEVAKGKRAKVLPLSDSALEVLKSLSSRGTHEFVIVSRTGKRMTTLTKAWTKIRNLAALPHYRYHDLRHQFATHLSRAGRSTAEIQRLLSHRSPVTTDRYIGLQSSDLFVASNSASAMVKAAMPVMANEETSMPVAIESEMTKTDERAAAVAPTTA